MTTDIHYAIADFYKAHLCFLATSTMFDEQVFSLANHTLADVSNARPDFIYSRCFRKVGDVPAELERPVYSEMWKDEGVGHGDHEG